MRKMKDKFIELKRDIASKPSKYLIDVDLGELKKHEEETESFTLEDVFYLLEMVEGWDITPMGDNGWTISLVNA